MEPTENDVWRAVGAALDARDKVAIAAWLPHVRSLTLVELIATKSAEFGWAEECVQASRRIPDPIQGALRAAEHAHIPVLESLHRYGLVAPAAVAAQIEKWPDDDESSLRVATWLCHAGAPADEALLGFLREPWRVSRRPRTFDALIGEARRADVLNKAVETALRGLCSEQANRALQRLAAIGADVNITKVELLRRAAGAGLTRRLIQQNGHRDSLDLDSWLQYASMTRDVAVVRVLIEEGARDAEGIALRNALSMRNTAAAQVLMRPFPVQYRRHEVDMTKLVQRLVTHAHDAFRVYFPYSSALVEGIRAVPKRRFVKGTADSYWEVPAAAENVRALVTFIETHGFKVEPAVAEQLQVLAAEASQPRELPPDIIGRVDGGNLVEFLYRPRDFDPSARDVVRSAPGAHWNRDTREWQIPFSRQAVEVLKALVADHAATMTHDLPALADAQLRKIADMVRLSSATNTDIEIPVPFGLEYRGFQKVGIAYAVAKGSAIIGDEPGLGKTIQACGVANAVPEIQSVLLIVPASLKANWRREWDKWSVKNPVIGTVNGGDASGWPDKADVVIISHQSVAKHRERIDARHWDLVVCDEAHRLKNPKAQRTIAILGEEDRETRKVVRQIKADRFLALTGTPIVNRPNELWTLLRTVCPQRFSDFFSYAKRYCGAVRTAYGWDFGDASNLTELQDELRAHCMVRRLKKDVLSELPRKIRQIVPIENDRALRLESKARAKIDEKLAELEARMTLAYLGDDRRAYEKAAAELKKARRFGFDEMARVRHDTALAKVPQVVEMLHEVLEEDPERKILLFAHHADVIDAYAEAFGDIAVTLDGRVPLAKRQDRVDRFQADPSVRVFIGGIQVAGVGYTLTAASLVAVAEPVWVPGDLTQVEDRAHRIGQTGSVQVWHLVVDGSIEQRMMEAVIDKQQKIDAAMDGATADGTGIDWEGVDAVVARVEEGEAIELPALTCVDATELAAWEAEKQLSPEERRAKRRNARSAERAEGRASERGLQQAADSMTVAQIHAVHEGLKSLACVCDGAVEEDGVGFNGADTRVGRALALMDELTPLMAAYAREMLQKYSGQIGMATIERMWAVEEAEADAEVAPGM